MQRCSKRWLADNDLAGEDDALPRARAVIDSGGRSRAFINGRTRHRRAVARGGEHLVDIHGQHEHQSLLRGAAQRDLLDAYAGLEDAVAAVCRVRGARGRTLRNQLSPSKPMQRRSPPSAKSSNGRCASSTQLKFGPR